MSGFTKYDLHVYEAHSLAEVGGGASYEEIFARHDGYLPWQRLTGMQRRGLVEKREDGYWYLTRHGVWLASQYREGRDV